MNEHRRLNTQLLELFRRIIKVNRNDIEVELVSLSLNQKLKKDVLTERTGTLRASILTSLDEEMNLLGIDEQILVRSIRIRGRIAVVAHLATHIRWFSSIIGRR